MRQLFMPNRLLDRSVDPDLVKLDIEPVIIHPLLFDTLLLLTEETTDPTTRASNLL